MTLMNTQVKVNYNPFMPFKTHTHTHNNGKESIIFGKYPLCRTLWHMALTNESQMQHVMLPYNMIWQLYKYWKYYILYNNPNGLRVWVSSAVTPYHAPYSCPCPCSNSYSWQVANCAKVTCDWQPKLTVSLGLALKLPSTARNCRLIASHFFWQMRDALVNGRNVSIKKFHLPWHCTVEGI